MKNRKRHFTIALLIPLALVSPQASADDTNIIAVDFEKNIHYIVVATNGLKLGFFSYTQPPYSVEQAVELSFISFPKSSGPVYLPKNEYVGRFTLYDTNNLPVPKTALGESFNLKSDLQWNSKLMRQSGTGTNGQAPDPWHEYSDNEWILYKGWTRLADFPKINELFQIQKSGNYRLVLEVQIFLSTMGNKAIVHFPPLEIPVVQPEK